MNKLKVLFLVVLSILTQLSMQLSKCPPYDWTNDVADMQPMPGRQWATLKNDNKVHIQDCGSDSLYCPVSLTNTLNVECAKETFPPWQRDLAPGDICSDDDQCFKLNTCNNGVCSGKPGKSSCIYNRECDVGSHCLNKVCTKVIEKLEECHEDQGDKWAFGTMCHQDVCKPFAELSVGDEITSKDYEYLCNTFHAENAEIDSNKILCGIAPKLIDGNFRKPDPEDITCNYTAAYPDTQDPYFKIEYAKWGTNQDDAHYCPKFRGEISDNKNKEYQRMWKQGFNCHVNSNSVYWKDVIDAGYEELMAEWETDMFETESDYSYPLVANNKEWLKGILNREYWKYESEEDSAYGLTKMTLVALMTIIMLFFLE